MIRTVSGVLLHENPHSTRGQRAQNGAFTLIELLVVISIVALLIALLLPALVTTTEIARRAVCAGNVRSMLLGLQVYAEDSEKQLPVRSAYFPLTLDYFRQGPGGPTSNDHGDFSGIYPGYVPAPGTQYCPSGPWVPQTVIGTSTMFYGHRPWHGIWGRNITYNYLGNQTVDITGGPAVDINGLAVEFPSESSDAPDLVVITDANWYHPTEDWYGRSTHPSIEAQASDEAIPRDGLNVGVLDGSVHWRNEAETVPRLLIRISGWWARH